MVITLIATSTCLPMASYAENHGGPQHQQWRQQGHGGPRGHEGHGGHGGHDNRGRPGPGNFHGGGRDHFAWNGHNFRRGYPAPARYRGDRYRINDWRQRGLYAPPYGDHWAYVNGNYVLIAAATGIITSIIISNALNH